MSHDPLMLLPTAHYLSTRSPQTRRPIDVAAEEVRLAHDVARRGLGFSPEWNERRHSFLVAPIVVAEEFDKIPLLEKDAHQDIGSRHGGEEEEAADETGEQSSASTGYSTQDE